MRSIGVDERRARLARRHHLAVSARARDPAAIAADLVALHASDPATVFLAAAARLRAPAVEPIEQALYVDRHLVRMLGMRRTMWVVPVATVPIVQAACTHAVAALERRRTHQILAKAGIVDDGGAWLKRVEAATLHALEKRGSATTAQLGKDVPELQIKIPYGEGKKWAGVQAVSFRVMTQLSADGKIVRGRPGGTWTSSQYQWAPLSSWLPGGMPETPTATARAELARRWLASFGPATTADLKWWAGWTVGDTKRALAALDVAEVDLDGTPGWVLADDVDPVPAPDPWVALLPALDPTVMGWADRTWYLGEHRAALFDRNGNAGPTVWCDGRIVGGWAQRRDGEIVFRLLEDVGADQTVAIEEAAAPVKAFFGDVRAIPRFRTPLERELTA